MSTNGCSVEAPTYNQHGAEKFWMVAGQYQGPARACHSSLASAENEARRLARNNPGFRFYVVEAVSFYVSVQPVQSVALTESDDFPF